MIRNCLMPLALVSALAGCSLAPIYERPDTPVGPQWTSPAQGPGIATDAQVSAASLAWRDVILDARLRELITLSLEHNRDLRVALLNVEAARAQHRIERSALTPGLGAGAQGTRQRMPGDLSASGEPTISSQYQVGVSMPSFEIDLFGRLRNLSEAALQTYLATEATQRNVQITLISQVAEAYLNTIAADAQLQRVDANLQSRQESYDLVRLRYDNGVASELDLAQATSLLASARSTRQSLLRTRQQAANALLLLTGLPDFPALPDAAAFGTTPVIADIPVGVPSEVLLQRPDVIAAEYQLQAANANIGAARAAFFPSISLTAMFGTASSDLSGLFSGGSTSWSFAPMITVPIFAGGRLRGQLDVAEVRRDIGVAQYEGTLQQAFREVNDALAGTATYSQQVAAETELVQVSHRSLELSNLRYEQGIDSFLQVQDAQRDLLTAEQQWLQTQLAEQVNRLSLYKALGGGWQADAALSQRADANPS